MSFQFLICPRYPIFRLQAFILQNQLAELLDWFVWKLEDISLVHDHWRLCTYYQIMGIVDVLCHAYVFLSVILQICDVGSKVLLQNRVNSFPSANGRMLKTVALPLTCW